MKNKILLIDDETEFRLNIAEMLRAENYEVITAENGLNGMLKAFSEIPDLILCDLMMPEMSGEIMLEKLRENEETKNIPYIIISAKRELSKIKNGIESGASKFFEKPVRISELLKAIEAALNPEKNPIKNEK